MFEQTQTRLDGFKLSVLSLGELLAFFKWNEVCKRVVFIISKYKNSYWERRFQGCMYRCVCKGQCYNLSNKQNLSNPRIMRREDPFRCGRDTVPGHPAPQIWSRPNFCLLLRPRILYWFYAAHHTWLCWIIIILLLFADSIFTLTYACLGL